MKVAFLGEHMNEISRKRRVACLILLSTILLTLLFIFGNSLASQEESKELSDQVNESIGEIITVITGKEESSLEDFFTKYHRKIAHFVEFAFLGLQVVLLLHFAKKNRFPDLLSGALLSFIVASLDEGIQMFTGRGDQVADVFIDALGYLCAYLIGALLLYCIFWRRERKAQTEPYEEKTLV